jgi:hypothetical protein
MWSNSQLLDFFFRPQRLLLPAPLFEHQHWSATLASPRAAAALHRPEAEHPTVWSLP